MSALDAPVDVALLDGLLRSGVWAAVIARELGIPYHQVWRRAERIGVEAQASGKGVRCQHTEVRQGSAIAVAEGCTRKAAVRVRSHGSDGLAVDLLLCSQHGFPYALDAVRTGLRGVKSGVTVERMA